MIPVLFISKYLPGKDYLCNVHINKKGSRDKMLNLLQDAGDYPYRIPHEVHAKEKYSESAIKIYFSAVEFCISGRQDKNSYFLRNSVHRVIHL